MKKLLLLPALLLALTACTGNVSFNEEEIQEIAKNNPDEGFDVLVRRSGSIDNGQPLFVLRLKNSQLNEDIRTKLRDGGYTILKSGEYDEYKAVFDEDSDFASIAPKSIAAIEILKDITPEVSDRYGDESGNGVVLITIKDDAIRTMFQKEK